ncbi:MAG TPA: hypothetical protein VIJ94_13020, partial [Caulobacteraceae bacterium]
YDLKSRQSLGTFPATPGQSFRLNDGKTTVTFGLPSDPPADVPSGSDDLDELRRKQADFANTVQRYDPLGVAYRGFDQWAHPIQRPRVLDYLQISGNLNPEYDIATQIDSLNANVPEARGTRPTTANDVLNAGASVLAPLGELAGAARVGSVAADSLDVLAGRAAGGLIQKWLPPSQAALRGIPRFNPNIPEHALGASGEEALAKAVHEIPDEQVVHWGDPIGANGADVVSVNRPTGDVTLWGAKSRSANVRIQHSPTFEIGGQPREKAISQAMQRLTADTTLPSNVRRKALQNLAAKRVQTRTFGYGNAKNSVVGN